MLINLLCVWVCGGWGGGYWLWVNITAFITEHYTGYMSVKNETVGQEGQYGSGVSKRPEVRRRLDQFKAFPTREKHAHK